ncbi:MAG: flavin monoamine oxidase family protein [Alphaproteobacteria bacterium]|jgi:monoamine oxidase
MTDLLTVDVVIVGAGIAGLTAAHRLVQSGQRVAVLEARDRVGGRIYGFKDGERVVQLGGRWTGPGQTHIKALAAELGVGLRPLQAFDDAGAERGGGLDVPGAARVIDALAECVPLEAPWDAPGARTLDGKTLATYLDETFEADLSLALGSLLMGFLPEPQECSLLHALTYLKSNGGFAGILGLDGPAHDSEVFEGGAHELTDRLAVLVGDRIRLETPVYSLEQIDGGVVAHTQLGSFSGRHAIVAMPPVLAGRLVYEPAMPPLRDYLTQRMPIRGKYAVAALYDVPFWLDHGGTGTVATDTIFAWDEGGPTRPACITGLVSMARSREIDAMTPGDRRAAVLDDLVVGLGPRARDAVGYHEINWAGEPWSRGCNSYLTTGAWTAYGHTLRPSVGRIHWAGAEYTVEFIGQMEGAVRTAEAAVTVIAADGANHG